MQSITKPIRLTSNSSTLIVNVIYNLKQLFNTVSDVKSGLLNSDVADHLPICVIFTFDVNHYSVKPRYIFNKSYQINDNSLGRLSDVLINTQWNDLTDVHDAKTAYDMFHDKFSQIYNEFIPLITKKISLGRP